VDVEIIPVRRYGCTNLVSPDTGMDSDPSALDAVRHSEQSEHSSNQNEATGRVAVPHETSRRPFLTTAMRGRGFRR
jgi:hypothetical protein